MNTNDKQITAQSAADEIRALNPCAGALAWAEQFPTLEAAWTACQRGDWMLWLAGKRSGEPMSDKRRPLVLAACECARLALPRIPEGELRPLQAIELAEQWALRERKVSRTELYAAAAYAAAAYAAYAAAAADTAYAQIHVLRECADIVRRHYPEAPR